MQTTALSAPSSKLNLYLIEYYTKNPATGEGGWDIRFAWVGAENKMIASMKVRRERDNSGRKMEFDVVIDCNEQYGITPLVGCGTNDIRFIDAHKFIS